MHVNNMQPMPQIPVAKVKVAAQQFAAKYRPKRECYNFLSVDVGVYLPSYSKSHESLRLRLSSYKESSSNILLTMYPNSMRYNTE